jgi:hypothetical protein
METSPRRPQPHVVIFASIGVVALALVFAACAPAPTPQAQATAAVGTVQAVASVAPTVQAAVQASVAAAVQTTGPQVAATAQAAASQVAPAVGAAQTQTAPTVSAIQTQIAPTAAAISTQAAATLQPVAATAVAGSPVQISQVKVSDADTTISIHNSGARQISIGGWILFMGTFPFVLPTNPNMRIDPGQTLTLHFTRGTDTPTDVYVGQAPQPLVNNLQNGATLALVDLTGQLAAYYRIP